MVIYYIIMIRTQIQLPEHQHQLLRRRSAEKGKSIALQIREAIDLYLRVNERTGIKTIKDIAGKYKPQPIEDLKEHDRGFVEAIQESKGWSESS